MLTNLAVKGIHASRYIMSWVRSGGQLTRWNGGYSKFEEWLISLGLTEGERRCIMEIARNGKMELEFSAEKFLKNNS